MLLFWPIKIKRVNQKLGHDFMPEIFLPKVVTVFPLKAFKKLSFQFLIVHRNHPFCDLNIPPFRAKFNPQYFTKLKCSGYAEHRKCVSAIDICPPGEYIINVGRPKKGRLFLFLGKKKAPDRRKHKHK